MIFGIFKILCLDGNAIQGGSYLNGRKVFITKRKQTQARNKGDFKRHAAVLVVLAVVSLQNSI